MNDDEHRMDTTAEEEGLLVELELTEGVELQITTDDTAEPRETHILPSECLFEEMQTRQARRKIHTKPPYETKP